MAIMTTPGRLTGLSLATLYSTCQCVLSVVGSIGVILLFAGIPQLIYAPQLNVGNLLTFLSGALLITAMVAGNAALNFRYQEHCRQEADAAQAQIESANRRTAEDKPPNYETLAELEGLPAYHQVMQEKPPRYEDITDEVVIQVQTESSSSEKNLKGNANATPIKQAVEDDALSDAHSSSAVTISQLATTSPVSDSIQEKNLLTSSSNASSSAVTNSQLPTTSPVSDTVQEKILLASSSNASESETSSDRGTCEESKT